MGRVLEENIGGAALPAQPNQSLMDGLACLQALATHKEAVGGRALARELGLETTRVNRLLKTLAFLGMAEQTGDRKYLPGAGMHVLAAQALFASGLLRVAVPGLERLGKLKLIVALGVLWRDQTTYLYHAGVGMPASAALGRVGVFPATRSSIGLVLLAQQEEEAVRGTFAGRAIEGFKTVEGLVKELRRVRGRGYAVVRQEEEPLRVSVAVPVRGARGRVQAGIAVAGGIGEGEMEGVLGRLREEAEGMGGGGIE